MKKFIIIALCCIGLVILTNSNKVDLAEDAKPEITSIGIGIGIGIGTYK